MELRGHRHTAASASFVSVCGKRRSGHRCRTIFRIRFSDVSGDMNNIFITSTEEQKMYDRRAASLIVANGELVMLIAWWLMVDRAKEGRDVPTLWNNCLHPGGSISHSENNSASNDVGSRTDGIGIGPQVNTFQLPKIPTPARASRPFPMRTFLSCSSALRAWGGEAALRFGAVYPAAGESLVF